MHRPVRGSAHASDPRASELSAPRPQACQDYALLGARVVSPHAPSYGTSASESVPKEESEQRRKLWKKWADDVNGR